MKTLEKEEKNLLEMKTPPDGNCFFTSVMMAYLTPVLKDEKEFDIRCAQLFGNTSHTSDAKNIVTKYLSADIIFDKFDKKDSDYILLNKLATTFRIKIISFMRKNESDFSPFIDMESEVSFENYLEKMSSPTKWADNLEIEATSGLLQTPIRVHQQGGNVPTYREDFKNSPIEIAFVPAGNTGVNNHYEFYIKKEDHLNIQKLNIQKSHENSKPTKIMFDSFTDLSSEILELEGFTFSNKCPEKNFTYSTEEVLFDSFESIEKKDNFYPMTAGLLKGIIYQEKKTPPQDGNDDKNTNDKKRKPEDDGNPLGPKK